MVMFMGGPANANVNAGCSGHHSHSLVLVVLILILILIDWLIDWLSLCRCDGWMDRMGVHLSFLCLLACLCCFLFRQTSVVCHVIAWCLSKQCPYRLGTRYYVRMTSYTMRCRAGRGSFHYSSNNFETSSPTTELRRRHMKLSYYCTPKIISSMLNVQYVL